MIANLFRASAAIAENRALRADIALKDKQITNLSAQVAALTPKRGQGGRFVKGAGL